MRFLLVWFILLCSTVALHAQLRLVSSVPADGAVDVETFTTVSFTFNMPLDADNNFIETILPINHLNFNIAVDNITYSDDGRTISFEVKSPAEAPVTWLVFGAHGEGGESLDHPYAINYTTAAATGENSVSGRVFYDAGSPVNTMIGLTNQPLLEADEEARMLYGTVVQNSDGSFELENVEDGVYWPAAFLDVNGNGLLSPEFDADLIAYYDPDMDRRPDSIVVSGGTVSGVDMALLDLTMEVTARDVLQISDFLAGEYASDQELRGIFACCRFDQEDGFSLAWRFVYYSPSGGFPTHVSIAPTGTSVDTTAMLEPYLPPSFVEIPEGFVDSDEAANVMLAAGGQMVLDTTWIHNVSLYGGYFGPNFGLPSDLGPIWVGEYVYNIPGAPVTNDSIPRDTIWFFVDMESGELISGPSSVDEVVTYDGITLWQNFPNPVSDETVITYTVERPTDIHLAVYDMQGRELMVLVDGRKEVGEYSATVDVSSIPSGLYLYRLITPTGSISRQITVLK